MWQATVVPDTPTQLLDRLAASSTFELCEARADGVLKRCNGEALRARVHLYGRALGSRTSLAGQRVVVLMRSGVDSVALLFAIWEKGAVPILLRSTHPRTAMLELANRYQASYVALDASLARGLPLHERSDGLALPGGLDIVRINDDRPVPVARGEHALGIPTSGSTGVPRVVLNSFDRLWLNARMHAASVGVSANDHVLLSLPLSFSYGFVAGLLGGMASEARVTLGGVHRGDAGHVTVMMATPASSHELLTMPALRPRVLTVGGDVLHKPLALALIERMPSTRLFATYGLTEAGPRVASSAVTVDVLEACGGVPLGEPLDGVSWRLHDVTGVDEVGELEVSSPTLMHGYMDDAQTTSEVLLDGGRALRTGDLFAMRAGRPVFCGRRKRLIVRGGEKIFPAMVESRILSLRGVRDAWVTAEAHATYGEVPVAYVVPHAHVDMHFDVDGAARQLRAVLPASHIPVTWSVVDALPPQARK